MDSKLKSIHIDFEKKQLLINGKDVSSITSYFNLTFDGCWKLELNQSQVYGIDGKGKSRTSKDTT